MTSNPFFFKIMKEDLRHKIWMMALSVLTSILMLPVAWLIWWSNRTGPGATNALFLLEKNRPQAILQTIDFFRGYLILVGGIQTIVGALVTGLSGFRYVFHKNMVDTYHSLPVKRSTLFASEYMNGILIWIIPFAVNLSATAVMAGCFLRQLGGDSRDMEKLFAETCVSFLALVTAFLLVYSLAVTAVMLSGNLLNTLVSMAILGCGAISAFGIGYGFFAVYMEHFYNAIDWSAMVYSSPLATALAILFWRADQSGNLGLKLGIGLLLAAALGWCAWRLYRGRASELAEQGVRNRPAAALMRMLSGVVAGMCGWLLLVMLVGRWNVFWGVFGLVLAAVLVFVVLNIIFSMDFKAFSCHKRQLAAVLAVTLVICFAFHWDWLGYDDYLPEKEDIAEMAVYHIIFSNRYISESAEESSLQQMHFRDTDAIYACLEHLTKESAEGAASLRELIARITLQNGRSYYRRYFLDEENQEVLWPLLSSKEYVQHAFCVSDEDIARCTTFTMRRGGEREVFKTSMSADAFAAIVHAYNQDVLENPQAAFRMGGRLLAHMDLNVETRSGGTNPITLSLYEDMQHTVEAVREGGFGEWLRTPESSEVQEILLPLYNYDESATVQEILTTARQVYGVPSPGDTAQGADVASGEDTAQGVDAVPGEDTASEARTESEGAEASEVTGQVLPDREIEEMASMEVHITDRTEVEEVLALLSFTEPFRSDLVFRKGYVVISYIDGEGNVRECYLPRGVLPERYILKFWDCS